MPLWATVLAAAEAGLGKPWEIAGGTPEEWFWRWVDYRDEVARAADRK